MSDATRLVLDLVPERTVLLFGAGSSIPSNAPSVASLQTQLEAEFGTSATEYNLAEQTGIIESKPTGRAPLIASLRRAVAPAKPTGALLNLPLYGWKSIFTTNYDELIEQSYKRRGRPISVYASNFDFGKPREPESLQLFKLHGTIDQDVSDGHRSRIIITVNDYDQTEEYREQLFDRFKSDISGEHLIIIGHSLADPDIKEVVDRSLKIRAQSGGGGRISMLSYTEDEGRATLLRSRGMDVFFGGLDDFFAALALRVAGERLVTTPSSDPLDIRSALRPATLDAAHASATGRADVGNMFNGWPASYADVKAGLTFPRSVTRKVSDQLALGDNQVAVLLGPSGVGKTTAARQILGSLLGSGYLCWEHKLDQTLYGKEWRQVASLLQKTGQKGCLLIDNAHLELKEINNLMDGLASDENTHLKLLLTSSKNQWNPRVKTPAFFKLSTEHSFNRITGEEIDGLLDLVERVPEVKQLVERSFDGFTRAEKRQRLVGRCDADMFVCLKNIFSSDSLDDIILREYAELSESLQDIYRSIAAMESAGVHVHRQLVIRILGIPAMSIAAALEGLKDIVHEQSVNERQGIYAWRGRHPVIMGIIAQHKYYTEKSRYDLFLKVIDNISPTYDIEIKTIRELCNTETGISTLYDKRQQNILLRKMMSIAPGQRVPRHRLIRNLIALGEYDAAATEIRVFEADFRLDGPSARYKIDLSVTRALRSPGLLEEDRIAILRRAAETAASLVSRFSLNKAVLAAYCDVGLALVSLAKDTVVFDHAMGRMNDAELKSHDPEITRIISRYEQAFMRASEGLELGAVLDEDEIKDDE